MALKVYGLKKCSTCQKAEDWLSEHKLAFTFTDVKEGDGVTEPQVLGWIKAVGGWEKLVNRAGYTWRGIPEALRNDLSEAGAVSLILANPSLIRRPLIENGDVVTVGFSEKVKSTLV